MNRQEILKEINELKERLNNLEKMYDSAPNERWRAEKLESYYYLNAEGEICCDNEGDAFVDDFRYDIGNYFKTIEQAEFEAERLKIIAELREWATPPSEFDWNDTNDNKYIILLESGKVRVDFFGTCQTSDLYFKTREQAWNAIEAVGKDRIIKYYFRR